MMLIAAIKKCQNLYCPNESSEGTLHLVQFWPAVNRKGARPVVLILCPGCAKTIEDDTETKSLKESLT